MHRPLSIIILCFLATITLTAYQFTIKSPTQTPKLSNSIQYEIAGDTLFTQKEFSSALNKYQTALDTKERTQRLDSLYYKISKCYAKLGEYPKVIEALQKGIEILPKLHIEASRYHNNIGYYNEVLGNNKQAIECYKKVIEIKQKYNQPIAKYYASTAFLYNNLGEYAQSIFFYKKAIKIYSQQKDWKALVKFYSNLGEAFFNQKSYSDALFSYNQAHDTYQTHDVKSYGFANILTGRGNTYYYLKKYNKAIEQYKHALEFLQEAKDTLGMAKTLNNLGDTYGTIKKWAKAEDYLQQALQLKLNLAQKDTFSIASSFNNIGEFYLNKNQSLKARNYYQKAINFSLQLKINSNELPSQKQLQNAINKPVLLIYLTDLVKAYHQQYQEKEDIVVLQKIYQTYQKADDLIQLLLNDVSEKSQLIWVNQTHDIYEKAIEVAYLLHQNEPNQEFIQQAFNFLEHHKAVVLYRASQKNKALPLVQSIEILSNIQQKLNPTDCILAYFVGKTIYTFTITKTGITLTPIQNTTELTELSTKLVQFVKENNQTLDGYKNYTKTAYTLYKDLIQPFVTSKCKRLICIPDGFLYHTPFACLITESQNNPTHITFDLPYLIQQYPITYGYSVGMLLKNLEHTPIDQQQQMAVYAPSFPSASFNLAPLTATQNNISTIEKILPSSIYPNDVPLESFYQTHTKHSILYFATHAAMDTLNSDLGKIYFSDSVLTTQKLYNLQLKHDLIILGTCESGGGQVIQGEGVMSLSRAFMYAGSASVVATLFEVNNQTTTTLINQFLTQIQSTQPKDIALQLAQQQIISSPQKHPHYWAAFTHTGNWKSLSVASVRWWQYGLGILLLILLAFAGRRFFAKKV